jgi:hypothetical protein
MSDLPKPHWIGCFVFFVIAALGISGLAIIMYLSGTVPGY